MRVGPVSREQLNRLRRVWRQGEHALISGPTGSGKTTLARELLDIRFDAGGHVIVFVMKPRADSTLTDDYLRDGGYVRWTKFHKRAPSWERRVLLWADTAGMKGDAILAHQREVYTEAMDEISDKGNRTVCIDDALYMTDPEFLGMRSQLAMGHAMGRSHGLTFIDNMQRPSHMPLIVYGSAAHAFVGRTREVSDQRRLAELGAQESSRELADMIHANKRHGFTWIPVAPDWPAEPMDLTR